MADAPRTRPRAILGAMKIVTPQRRLTLGAAIDRSVIHGTLTAPTGDRRDFHSMTEPLVSSRRCPDDDEVWRCSRRSTAWDTAFESEVRDAGTQRTKDRREVRPEVFNEERAVIDNVTQLESAERSGERIGLVLSGGAARGAYEVGVLSVLAPALERRGERPRIIVGTSAGGLNAAFLASEAQEGLVSAVESGCRMWRELEYGDVLGPLLSPREFRRAVGYGLEFLGVAAGSMRSVLDNTPLADTIKARISFDRLAENVQAGVIETAAVVATSYDTGRSVVFHDGGSRPPRDDLRGIDYARTRLAATHVRASSAIEGLFPAAEVPESAGMDGWYGDGGTGLNTPFKPALAFGAERVIVIGLNSLAGSPRAVAKRPPDALEGAAQALQAPVWGPTRERCRDVVDDQPDRRRPRARSAGRPD